MLRRHIINHGEHSVSNDQDMTFSVTLGSCVAACLHDPFLKIGGANHILLPGEAGQAGYGEGKRYGAFLMESLLNDLFKMGAVRERLQLKLFGGAQMFGSVNNPGSRNVEFALSYAANEGLNVVSSSLRGNCGRRIEYWPASGRVRQRLLKDAVEEKVETKPRPKVADTGDLDLF